MSLQQKLIIVLSIGLVTLAADQATKVWARRALMAPGEIHLGLGHGSKKRVIPVVGSTPGSRAELRLAFNKGAAFGLFNRTAGSRVFLSLIGLAALALVFYLLRRPETDSRLFAIALACVTGGAVGNLVDRIAFGQVTDFIWVWLTPRWKLVWPWPAFNIADIALVVGVILMIPPLILRQGGAADGSEDEADEPKGKRRREAADDEASRA